MNNKELMENLKSSAVDVFKLILQNHLPEFVVGVTLVAVLLASKANRAREVYRTDDVLYLPTTHIELSRIRELGGELLFETEVGEFALVSTDD